MESTSRDRMPAAEETELSCDIAYVLSCIDPLNAHA